ncbi:hypothetical protein [Catelliglobosispora koreensis]|uniref:hypothetical protein n=1 Tax=Catelliglobosispora koreensis TaxID=129052 RepID=UPI00037A1B91|nr:hypothetical protein [Catelliglobosispora koreensis]
MRIKSLLAALGLSLAAVLVPSAAHAVIVDIDYFKITAQHADFGDGNLGNISGRPTQDGELEWDLTAGVYTPRLDGKVWINNSADSCVRLQLVYAVSNAADPTHTTGTWCAPDGGTWYGWVSFAPFASAYITQVTVKLQFQEEPGGPWVTVGQSAWIPT